MHKKNNPAVADKELLSHRLGKCSHVSSACQERTCAKAGTRVTLIMATKSQEDNLFHLQLLKTRADAVTQHAALKASPPLRRQAPNSTGLAATSLSSFSGSESVQSTPNHTLAKTNSYFYLTFLYGEGRGN